jgi:tryptophan 2,3-dioxygenase
MSLPENIVGRIKQLEEKYNAIGQDMNAYLDGLLTSNVTSYWEYINVDTLLSLQHPKTDFPDELIFIIYHQITELYFKLSLHELVQIANNGRNVEPSGEDKGWKEKLDADYFARRITRVNRFIRHYGGWNGERTVPAFPNGFASCKRFSKCTISHD